MPNWIVYRIKKSSQIKDGLLYRVLADVSLSSAASSISSGTFSASDMLRITALGPSPTGNCLLRLTFNGDTGANYGWRHSENGGAEQTGANDNNIECNSTLSNDPFKLDAGVNNLTTAEKIVDYALTLGNPPGAPDNITGRGGWADVSRITSVTLSASANTLDAGTRLIVEGI